MGAELFIVLEREIPDFDAYVNGRRLSQAEPQLDAFAAELDVTPLMNFFSQNPQEALDLMGDFGAEAGDIELPDETWFDAAEGLRTVQALIGRLRQNPNLCQNAADVVSDLEEFKAVLSRARDEGVRWHLAVDI